MDDLAGWLPPSEETQPTLAGVYSPTGSTDVMQHLQLGEERLHTLESLVALSTLGDRHFPSAVFTMTPGLRKVAMWSLECLKSFHYQPSRERPFPEDDDGPLLLLSTFPKDSHSLEP